MSNSTESINVDPSVWNYDPFVYDGHGYMELKPFDTDPRCLFGWGPPSCPHTFGHSCVREVGHPGECWAGGDFGACEKARRPRNWDAKLREECNR